MPYMELLDVGPPTFGCWYHLNTDDVDRTCSGSVTCPHVTICTKTNTLIRYRFNIYLIMDKFTNRQTNFNFYLWVTAPKYKPNENYVTIIKYL